MLYTLFDDYFLVVDTTILIVVPIVGSERTTTTQLQLLHSRNIQLPDWCVVYY
jgi:hypothetical protein